MLELNPSSDLVEQDRKEPIVTDKGTTGGTSRQPLQEVYTATRRELAKAYFDSDFRLRLLQEIESHQ
jgi:hypothetical protein